MPTPADSSDALASRSFGLLRDAAGHLILIDAEGTRHEGVRVQRTFPLTHPEQWISLGTDRGELALVENLADLPAATEQLIREELAQREFAPRIVRILDVIPWGEGLRWQVETDRGATTIELKNEEAVRRMGESRVVIHDIHGVRYVIPDLASLDRASRRRLERSM